jgi:hypothetical protein
VAASTTNTTDWHDADLAELIGTSVGHSCCNRAESAWEFGQSKQEGLKQNSDATTKQTVLSTEVEGLAGFAVKSETAKKGKGQLFARVCAE